MLNVSVNRDGLAQFLPGFRRYKKRQHNSCGNALAKSGTLQSLQRQKRRAVDSQYEFIQSFLGGEADFLYQE